MTDERDARDVRLREEELESMADRIFVALCNSPVWGERHTGELEEALSDGFALTLAPVVERIVAARVGEVVERVRPLVSDWQANGNSRELGDPTPAVWHQCARQLLLALDGRDPYDDEGNDDPPIARQTTRLLSCDRPSPLPLAPRWRQPSAGRHPVTADATDPRAYEWPRGGLSGACGDEQGSGGHGDRGGEVRPGDGRTERDVCTEDRCGNEAAPCEAKCWIWEEQR